MAATKIQWTNATWNPVVGCTWESPGCDHCYAATMTRRLQAMGKANYSGLTTKKHFNGTVRLLPDKLDVPLRRKKPTMYFVNSMSDLFHKDVPFEFVAKVFAVMMATPHHTYQVLTKRPRRMAQFFEWIATEKRGYMHEEFGLLSELGEVSERQWLNVVEFYHGSEPAKCIGDACAWPWPLPNVWLGTSTEDQQRADERIPWLLKCPAAVLFVSAEPLLEEIDLAPYIPMGPGHDPRGDHWCADCARWKGAIDWLIAGGESGPNARPSNIDHHRSLLRQCQETGVAFFEKQLGSHVVGSYHERMRMIGEPTKGEDAQVRWKLRDSKGGDISEFPEDLQVRQWPEATP